jgi:hypothetical protein
MSKFGLILVLTAALLVGCKGPSPEIAPYTSPTLTDKWTVSMTQSGGIMGMMRSIEVTSDGSYTVKDEREESTFSGELKEAQLTELKGMISSLEFASPKKPGACADCFVFDIAIQSDGQKMILQADDISLPESGMAPLVELLRGIMESKLK